MHMFYPVTTKRGGREYKNYLKCIFLSLMVHIYTFNPYCALLNFDNIRLVIVKGRIVMKATLHIYKVGS